MPIKYETYGCQFKCGTKYKRSFKQMQEHEEKCWHNPKNKTCMTCEHGELVKDYCEHTELEGCETEHWRYRDCNELKCEDVEFKENSIGEKIVPIEHCQYWKLRGI